MKNFLVNSMIFFSGLFQLRILHIFGDIVGFLLYIIPNKVSYVSKQNINICFPAENAAFRRQLLKNSLSELAKWLFELGPMWKWPIERLEKAIMSREGEEQVLDCLHKRQGVLIITPHFGNWELAGLAGSRRFPLTIMYKPPSIPALGAYMRNARARAGAKLVGTDRSGLKSMITALKNGEAVGMLPDQDPKEGSFVFAPFFGVDARTMTLFNKLIHKTGAAIFIASMKRLPRGRGYAFKYTRMTTGLDDADQVVAATALNHELEKIILECPEQYLWAYKRFKSRPDGAPNLY